MGKILLSSFLFLGLSCTNSDQKVKKDDSFSVSQDSSMQMPVNENGKNVNQQADYKVDTLNQEEKGFLTKLSTENEFLIIPMQIERFYLKDDSIPVLNKLIYSKGMLQEKGYIFLEVKYEGKISDVRLTYSYSLGQASVGYGSVIGDDTKNYLHTIKSCGVTACITQVFENGTKIFEKNN